jgi:hypothetical protein
LTKLLEWRETLTAITKSYFRTARQLPDGSYELSGNGRYVAEARFAIAGRQYVRTLLLLLTAEPGAPIW